MITIFAGVLSMIFFTRYLSNEDFGLLQYSFAFIAILSTIQSFGMDGFLLKEYAKNKDINLFHTAVIIKLILAVIIISGVYLMYIMYDLNLYLTVILSVQFLLQSFYVYKALYLYNENFKLLFKVNSLPILISLIIKVLILVYLDIYYLIIAFVFESIIVIYLLFNRTINLHLYFSYKSLKLLFWNCYPVLISSLSFILYSKTDRIMIGNMLGMHEVSIYSVANSLVEYSIILITIGQVYYNTKLVKIFTKSKELFDEKLLNITSLFAVFSLGLIFCLYFFGNQIINIVFGHKYNESYNILLILLPVIFFKFNGMFKPFYSIQNNLQKIMMITSLIAALLNIILNYFFINLYGINGAAYSTVVSVIFSFYLSNLLFFNLRPFFSIQNKSLFAMWRLDKHILLMKEVLNDRH
jgi:O-antigen/teichoic acid export membrane protein